MPYLKDKVAFKRADKIRLENTSDNNNNNKVIIYLIKITYLINIIYLI